MTGRTHILGMFPQLKHYAWASAVVWTIVIATSLVWNVVQMKQEILEAARIQARTAYEKDVIYRRWNAERGGVYVPVTKASKPNPYLSEIPERDIVTSSGKLLTLINPAYMTRQVHEMAEQEYGVRGHITSLNPIRPRNAPDPWETGALQAFRRGQVEVNSVEEINGGTYMRLMRPLITERGCLKCHSKQGYQEGDIRGGISVSIPMAPLAAIRNRRIRTLAMAHLLLLLTGMGGIVLVTKRLRQGEQNLVRLERLRALGEMSEGVSHNLNNILTCVLGPAQILQRTTEDPNVLRDVREIITATMRARDLVSQLALATRGVEEEPLQPVQVNEVVQDAVQAARPRWKDEPEARGIVIEMETDLADVSAVKATGARLRDIFINLILNAVDAMPEGGAITIRTRAAEEGVRIAVSDTGVGMHEETRRRVFEPFFTTKMDVGSGLGLSTAYNAVTRWGGRMDVESAPGEGTIFNLWLPAWTGMEEEVLG